MSDLCSALRAGFGLGMMVAGCSELLLASIAMGRT